MSAPSAKPLFRAISRSHHETAGRFFAKVSAPDDRGCMIWTGAVGSDGYGHFRWNGRVTPAHRVAAFLSSGSWPAQHVLHSCDVPLCCNPNHLREGSHAENMEECSIRRRNRTPRRGNGRAKLSQTDIQVIHALYAEGQTNKSLLARMFGVTPTRIRQVLK